MSSDDATKGIGEFLDRTWKDSKGQVVVAHITKGEKDTFRQYMVEWPTKRTTIIQFALAQSAKGNDVYFSPAVFKPREDCVKDEKTGKPTMERENVLGSWVYWADFDERRAPEDWEVTAKEKNIPKPTRIIQSSVERNQHTYWDSETFMSVEDFQESNRALAILLGADSSGWDAGQLLRFPHTVNYGYGPSGMKEWFVENNEQPAEAKLIYESDDKVPVGVFSEVVATKIEALAAIELGDIPSIRQVLTDKPLKDDFARVFNFTQEEASEAGQYKRSGTIQALAHMGAERGYSDEQIYAIMDDADLRWQKYSTNGVNARRKHKELLNCIAEARKKHGYLSADDMEFSGLIGGKKTDPNTSVQVVFNYRQFMESEINIDWLYENLMSTSSIGIFSGAPNVGKTQLGIQLAYSMALGLNFFQWKNCKGPIKVLFLSLEMGHPELKSFLQKTDREYPNQGLVLERNFHIFPSGVDLPLDSKAGQDFIMNLMKEYQPDVLFIDSLQKATATDLQDNVGMRKVMKFLDKIKIDNQCAIYLVHHNRKDDGKKSEGSLSDVFGSAFITANLDFVFGIREGDPGSDTVYMEQWKIRLGRKGMPIVLKRNENLQYTAGSADDSGFESSRLITGTPRGGQDLFG